MGILDRFRVSRQGAATKPRVERTLVVSDIHLGEDVLDENTDDLSRYITAINRELTAFVEYHAAMVGVRWHLIANGDLFDYVKLTLSSDDLEQGLLSEDNTPDVVVRKLDRIVEIHRPLFKALASFVLAGHRLTLIEGNHDAESIFPEVRERFVHHLTRLAERFSRDLKKGNDALDAEFVNRIQFRTWFESKSGDYHIEHGHAYDEWCAFEHNLAPWDYPGADRLATPLTHTTIPHFARAMGDFTTHGIDAMSPWAHLRTLTGLGSNTLTDVVRLYFKLLWRVIRKAGRRAQSARAELASVHQRRLVELASDVISPPTGDSLVSCPRSVYPLHALQALDRLRVTPADYSILKVICVFHADRLLVLGLAVVAALAPFVYGGWRGVLLGMGALAAGVAITVWARDKRSGNVKLDLEAAAQKVARLTGARYVVFGHSHRPVLRELKRDHENDASPASAYYLNSGCWVTREILRGEEGTGMTFVEMGEEGASLKRWRRHGEPEVLGSCHLSPLESGENTTERS